MLLIRKNTVYDLLNGCTVYGTAIDLYDQNIHIKIKNNIYKDLQMGTVLQQS